jgi:hypothetical protein
MLDMDYERLLNRASLLVTPTLYKEGVLYPQIPTYNSNGDFSVTRATTATRVNAAGLVELVPYNLLRYSEQFDNAAWVKTAGISVSANSAIAPDGTLTADTFAFVDSTSRVAQTVSLGAGGYTLSVYAKNEGGTGTCRLRGTVDGTLSTLLTFTPTSTWQRFEITFTAVTSITEIHIRSTDAVGNFAFWGAQLVQGTSALTYQATETRLNIPRLDYSLGSCPNILLEPQRTNLALWSQQFDDASWLKSNATVTANATISPSGIQNADKLFEDSTTNRHFLSRGSVPVGQSILSVFAKQGERKNIGIGNASEAAYAVFDLSNGTLVSISGLGGVLSNAKIQSIGDGWYRISVENNRASLSGFGIVTANDLGQVSYLGDGTSGVYIWGAQIEAGAYATSYIPTTSASVTRNADVISRGNIFTNGLVTASGGTWFVDIRNNRVLTRDTFGGLEVTNSATTSRIIIYNTGGTNRISIFITGAGVVFVTTSDTAKLAIKWNGTTADVFQNGIKVVSNVALTTTQFQILQATAGVPFNINSMALFPTPLTDGECSMLTSGVYTPALAYAQLGLVSESPACLDSSVNALL